MDNKSGFRIVGNTTNHPPKPPVGPDGEPALGATGFYYVTPADAWDDAAFMGRRRFTRLITLPTYIWRELLKGVFLAMVVFSAILMAVFAGQVMRDGIGPYTLLRVLPNFVPLICPFVMPLAIVTGIILCYSRLAKDNEIMAAYAGGVNPFWLMVPALVTSVIAIFVSLILNESALEPAIANIERLVIDDQANILRRMITRPGNITVQAGNEYVAMSKLDPSRDPENRTALDITRFASAAGDMPAGAVWDRRYPFPAKRVVARDHEVQDFSNAGDTEMVLKMLVSKPVFQDLHPTDINRTFIADGESGEERLILGGRPHVTIHSERASFWPILKLSGTRQEAIMELRDYDIDEEKFTAMPASQRRNIQARRDWLESRIQTRTSEINMRLALCFSCLAFAVLGIPLGMRTRGTMIASFVTGIATAGIYFLALKAAEAQVAKGLLSFWIIWIPDIVVVLLGVALWLSTSRRV